MKQTLVPVPDHLKELEVSGDMEVEEFYLVYDGPLGFSALSPTIHDGQVQATKGQSTPEGTTR